MSVGLGIGDYFSVNFTYNYAPMWHLATCNTRKRTVDIEGMTGAESEPLLQSALDNVEGNIVEFRKLAPSNGWGTVTGFVESLRMCIQAAKDDPDQVWDASR